MSPLLARGFRPFFLLAALFAAVGLPLWMFVRAGAVGVGDHLLPSAWHAHEMVFGFATAVIAGFMLTAVRQWTQRETAVGASLALLCGLWVAGRVVMQLGGWLPGWLITVTSLAFLPALALAVGRPIIQARSKRNYGLVLVLLALFAAQATTHLAALAGSLRWQIMGPRLGVGLVIVIVIVIGGRVIPIFTRNATKAEGIRNLPWLDGASIVAAVGLVAADLLGLHGAELGLLAAIATLANLGRMRHWGVQHSLRTPLLLVLHVGYLFIPLGFGLRAFAAFGPGVTDSVALHALTAGAIGTLVLGMMTRVSLGHTGRPLEAPPALGVAFVLVVLAALVRVGGPLVWAPWGATAIHLSAGLWTLAFLIYLGRIGPILLRARPDGRPG